MTDTDPATFVRQAEQEAAEAETLATTLAERVRNGEDISPDELDSAEKLGRFAGLRVEAAQRKAAKAREDERQQNLAALAAELRAHETDPDAFDQLLANIETAVTAFAQACADRNADVQRYREQMTQLGVPSTEQTPAKEHAHLGWSKNQGHVMVGNRSLRKIDAGPLVAAAVKRIGTEFGLQAGGGSFGSFMPDLIGPFGYHDLHEFLRGQA
ncbi:hypothetical protein [Lentzea albidocapillata]|uniref:Uncharacterized protein n=1 Tax=Lentzea albidocapillata TaxID=40571 RepID=A0A1W2FQJ1_9PSEU|nr:hypothetical protein [Lentzea albidocapillata]SMD24205.1 hypothetical protein SAMN05660733_07672 [Lentzea albidocapillata]